MIVGRNDKILVRRTEHSQNRVRIICRTRPRRSCQLLDARRPFNGTQRSLTPKLFKKRRFFAFRELVNVSCEIKICHLHWVRWWSLCLLGSRILQADSSSSHIPEIATVKILLGNVEVKDRRKRCVSVTLRLWSTYSVVWRCWAFGVRNRNGSCLTRKLSIEEPRPPREAA